MLDNLETSFFYREGISEEHGLFDSSFLNTKEKKYSPYFLFNQWVFAQNVMQII